MLTVHTYLGNKSFKHQKEKDKRGQNTKCYSSTIIKHNAPIGKDQWDAVKSFAFANDSKHIEMQKYHYHLVSTGQKVHLICQH